MIAHAKPSQTEMILEYLKQGHSLTPLEALEKLNCFRLSGRILELRQAGYNIKTDTIENNGKHFASYRLIKFIEETDGQKIMF